MTEENKIQNQNSQVIKSWVNVPYGLIADDIEEVTKERYFEEINEINSLYEVYEIGCSFLTEGAGGDYLPSDLKFKKASSIINKEARFLFSTPPDFNVNANDVERGKSKRNTILQDLVKRVLNKSNFNDNLLKACKDCFVGKRIAIVVNFNQTGIKVSFLNALSFLYETDDDDPNKITKFVFFYNNVSTTVRKDQRYFKKTYILENDVCKYKEELFDGLGNRLSEEQEYEATNLNFIPCYVVRNDGLTNDLDGKSELGYLIDYEAVYSKLANADIDAERKSMNPVRYAIDASSKSTENLPSGPGSFWDIQSDDTHEDPKTAKVGLLESSMNYSNALKTTLDRVENEMYSEVDVPNVNNEKLQGVITSGKTLNALYWGLTVRCDEKMLAWAPAIEFIIRTIIQGAKAYPEFARKYINESIPDIDYDVEVVNNYALPEDVQEEKNIDLSEVSSMTMSRKAYMKKWRKMSDEEADEELLQIKREQQLFDDGAITFEDVGINDDEDDEQDIPEDSLEAAGEI